MRLQLERVPDFGAVLQRPRLLQIISRAGDRPIVVCGCSGCGKSVLAAQYAQTQAAEARWIDAQGLVVRRSEVAAAICSSLFPDVRGHDLGVEAETDWVASLSYALSRDLERPSVGLIILDDVCAEDEEFDRLLAFGKRLAGAGLRLVVTSRSPSAGGRAIANHCHVVGRAELALTTPEAHELSVLLDCDRSPSLVDEWVRASSGHPGMFLVGLTAGSQSSDGMTHHRAFSEILRRSLSKPLESRQSAILYEAALLRVGRVDELTTGRVSEAEAVLADAAASVPLVAVWRDHEGAPVSFRVHEAVMMTLMDSESERDRGCFRRVLPVVTKALAARGDYARAAQLLSLYGDESARLEWLGENAREMLVSGSQRELMTMLGASSLCALTQYPELLECWAAALCECGYPEDAVHKAQAAADLYRHERDHLGLTRAELVRLKAQKDMGRISEALRVADSLMNPENIECLSNRAGLLVECGGLYLYAGKFARATSAVSIAETLGQRDHDRRAAYRLRSLAALLRGLSDGDFSDMARCLTSGLDDEMAWPSDMAARHGNLAVALLEMGRLRQTTRLLTEARTDVSVHYSTAQSAVRGLVECSSGEIQRGLEQVEQVIAGAAASRNESDVAVIGVYNAVSLRAAGKGEDALSSAERSYNLCAALDFMGFRRLAALEIAASLLALGDIAAARRWTDPLVSEGFGGNAYHALRAAMVLAECDRREGDLEQAVGRLAEHADHIRTESSNWQIAMYCRAFPELLGLFTKALGAVNLPAHMLKIVLPEYGERSLTLCRSWLEPADWRRLGRRLLGDAGFAQLDRRNGKPICRVRLFGGLDVTVAERTVAEKDWKKRKARLLFAMLIVRQGRDLAREQLFDHLWPDLSETKARNNYYVIWSAMKGALMGERSRSTACPYVENTGGRCRIVTDAVRSDIDEFEEALQEARAAEAVSDASAALAAYARVSMVYRGDLLPGDVYDDWFSDLRERYRFEFVDAMVHASELLLSQDDPCEALAYARRALRVDTLREDLYQMALRCQIAAGQRSGAIDTFIQCRTRLSEELGLDPSGETMELYQEVLVMEDRPRYDDFGLS